MLLSVLPNPGAATTDLIRLFHQAQLEWSRHLGEETQLDFGRWIRNPAFPDSDFANCVHDAYLLPNLNAEQLIDQMEAHCKEAVVSWQSCSLNPSANPVQATELVDVLTSRGWEPWPLDVLYRRTMVPVKPRDLRLTIIPSRASYRHYRQLLEMRAMEINSPVTRTSGPCVHLLDSRMPETSTPQVRAGGPCHDEISAVVKADLLHLDDPHLDSLLALRDGEPVGCISLLTTGEVGTLRDWFVAAPHRNQGIGRQLLERALEICARAQLKHIMLGVAEDSVAPNHLCRTAGFERIGQWASFKKSLIS